MLSICTTSEVTEQLKKTGAQDSSQHWNQKSRKFKNARINNVIKAVKTNLFKGNIYIKADWHAFSFYQSMNIKNNLSHKLNGLVGVFKKKIAKATLTEYNIMYFVQETGAIWDITSNSHSRRCCTSFFKYTQQVPTNSTYLPILVTLLDWKHWSLETFAILMHFLKLLSVILKYVFL